jgi:serine/threonine protein kinase
MSYCVTPGCDRPRNAPVDRVCQACGTGLMLRERYRAVQPLGQGGFGRTFLAIDEDIPSHPACVIKQLHLPSLPPSEYGYQKAVELFQQEAVRLDDLGSHPNIPALLAHFEQNRQLYLVQELIQGQTLAQELEQHGRFTEPQIWQLLHNLLPTLQFIHDRQVIHRDIKPANIIRRAEDRSLVLIDFGIAKLITVTTQTKTGTVVGSPEYMAPEQTRGKVLPASDLYSLGVVCIRLLTGASPFDLFDVSCDRWVWRDFLLPHQIVSARLEAVLEQLLHSALKRRFSSATAVLKTLEQVSPIARPPAPPSPSASIAQPSTTPDKSANLTGDLKIVPDLATTELASTALSGSELVIPEFAIAQADYNALRALLAAEKWQHADQLTWILIRRMLNKPDDGYVFSGELNSLPCADLQRMDEFWKVYSRDRFGFQVQARIYRAVDRDYGAFCDRVGWRRDNHRDTPKTFHFKSAAPAGHLPSRLALSGQQWWRHAAVMTTRLEQCGQ